MKNWMFCIGLVSVWTAFGCVEKGERIQRNDTGFEGQLPDSEAVFDTQSSDTDSGISNADTDSGGAIPETDSDLGCSESSDERPCPTAAAAACAEPVSPLPLLLTAEELGDDIVFMTLGNEALSALRQTETEQSVMLIARGRDWSASERAAAVMTTDPDVQVSLKGVVQPAYSDAFPAHVALICLDGDCSLYGADPAPQESVDLVPLENGTPPAIDHIAGLWAARDEPATVCVFGSKISCFDGATWRMMYDPGDGYPAVADMKTLGTGIVAVGETGLIVRDGFPGWTANWGQAYPDLISVLVDYGDYLAVSEDGRMYNLEKMWNPPCKIVDEDIAHITYVRGEQQGVPDYLGVTASGKVFTGYGDFDEEKDFCYTGQQVDNVVGLASNTCGLARNHLLLTADMLYGTLSCAIE